MKRHVQCAYCGKWFWTKIKKMYVIWLCDIVELETKTESGEVIVIHDKNKLKTCGALPTLEEAQTYVIPDMKEGQCKEIERIDTVMQNYCGRCLHDARLNYNNWQNRIKREARARMKSRGVKVKGDIINPISNEDMKQYMKYLVNQKIEGELKAKEDAEKKAEVAKQKALAEQRDKEAMEKREKLLKGEPQNVPPTQSTQ